MLPMLAHSHPIYNEHKDSIQNELVSKFLLDVENENYQQAYESIPLIIDHSETNSEVALSISDCYYYLDKNEDCIDFSLNAIKKHPYYKFYLYPRIANCYFYQKKYSDAQTFFELYINEINSESLRPSVSHIGIYAVTLHRLNKYSEAEELFVNCINLCLKQEELTLDQISQSKYRTFFQLIFREYAYNSIFQAKEKEGLSILKLASECGDEASIEMYNILLQSPTFAKDVQVKNKYIREFEKILFGYSNYKDLPNIPTSFWYRSQELNIELNKVHKAFNKKKQPKTFKKALNNIAKSGPYLELHLQRLYPYEPSYLESNLTINLAGDEELFKELRIYPANEPNAFATPQGHIYITQGLLYRYHFKDNLLLGVCAHELAHYLFAHSLVSEWKQQKKERKNKIMAGVAVGLNTAAHAVSSYYAAEAGVGANDDNYWSDYWNNVGQINNNLIYAFEKDAFYFRFKYSRAQEIEADLAAYRYCEAMGLGGYSYILALELLGDVSGYMKADKTSDHPTNSYRINFLKYLYAKEHPKNESAK
jgi:hypothetical protein